MVTVLARSVADALAPWCDDSCSVSRIDSAATHDQFFCLGFARRLSPSLAATRWTQLAIRIQYVTVIAGEDNDSARGFSFVQQTLDLRRQVLERPLRADLVRTTEMVINRVYHHSHDSLLGAA